MRADRRQVLKLIGGAGAALSLPLPAFEPPLHWRNWSGAQSCLPAARLAPESEPALAELLSGSRGPVRPVGAGHSFSALVPTDGLLLSADRLSGLICHDPQAGTADLWAGTRLRDAGEALLSVGLAMENLPDIDHQSLAGALATATHGTGAAFGPLSTQIAALRLVTPGGEILDCSPSQQPDLFAAACVSLGAFGVVTRVRLRVQPAFRLRERNWLERTDALLERIDELRLQHRHFELMPIAHSDYALAVALDETDEPFTAPPEADDARFLGMMRALDRHLGDLAPSLRRAILNAVAGRLRFSDRVGWSNRMLANIRNVRFNEMEYEVPAQDGPQCLREVLRRIRDEALPTYFPLEYRYVAADDLPLSPFFGRDSASISVHQGAELAWHGYFDRIEPIFWRHDGRPHWGKLHTLNHHVLRGLYPRWDEAMSVREQVDPQGRMLNGHLRELLGV